jgi:hypothetical protein
VGLEKNANIDPTAAVAYAKLVLPILDPELWYKLNLLTPEDSKQGTDYCLREVFRNAGFETRKRAYIRDESPPVFKERARHTAIAWVEDRVRRKLCGEDSRRAEVSGRCSECNAALVWSRRLSSRTALLCEVCGRENRYFCPICYHEMHHLRGKLFSCVNCSYYQVSEVEILEEATESYIFRCLKRGIDDPRIDDCIHVPVE